MGVRGSRWEGRGRDARLPRPRPCPAQAQPRQSRRTPRPTSPRNAARPRPLIGCGYGGGGPKQRAADSRWRRPRGGFQPSRRKGQECGGSGLLLAASAPGRGRWQAPEPALWSPRRDSEGRRRCRLPSLSRPPLFCAAALAHLLPSYSEALRRSRGGEGADALPPSLYLHSLPIAWAHPPPATTVTQTWARPAFGPAPGRAPPARGQSGAAVLTSRTRVQGGALKEARPGGAPPLRPFLRLAHRRSRLFGQDH